MDTKHIKISDYNYELPDERIAKFPLAQRDHSKLLIYKHGDISDDDCRTAKYTYQGREGYKKANGYMDNYPQGDQAKDWYNAHTGWSRFAFASEFNEPPIEVQGPYKEDRWYTMCFPFNLTRKQIEDIAGPDAAAGKNLDGISIGINQMFDHIRSKENIPKWFVFQG